MFNLSPKDIKAAMKRLGVKEEQIEAEEVVIRTKEKDIVVKEPKVSMVRWAGEETIQVAGKIFEYVRVTEEDVQTVADQANCSPEKARMALEKHNGDLAKAILELKHAEANS